MGVSTDDRREKGSDAMTADELTALARYRRSVVVPGMGRLPAAFVINMPFCVVVCRLDNIKEYVPPGRKPVALLPAPSREFYPQPNNVICCKSWQGERFEREVLSVVGEFAYCWHHGGTSFVPLNLITSIKWRYD